MAQVAGRAAPLARARALSHRERAVLVVGALAVAYLATRLALLWRFPPFFDEGHFYAEWVDRLDEGSAAAFVSFEVGREPLQTWLGYLWVQLGVEPLTAIRLVSLCSGLVTMTAIGLLARELGGDRAGIAAAVVYLVLPFTLVHDVVGVHDPLVNAAFSSALFLQLKIAQRPRLGLALPLGVAMAAALLSKESGKLVLLFLPLTLICFDWSQRELGQRLRAWLGCAAVAGLITLAGYLVMRLSPDWDTLVEAREDPIAPVRRLDAILDDPFGPVAGNWPELGLVGYLTVPLLLLCAYGAVAGLRTRPRLTLVMLAALALPLAVALIGPPTAYPRYGLYVVPAFAVLVGFGATRLIALAARELQPVRARIAVAAGVLIAVSLALRLDADVLADPDTARYPGRDDWQYVTSWPAGTGWRELADELERRVGPEGAVVVYSIGFNDELERMLDNPAVSFVASNAPNAAQADFLVQNTPFVFPDDDFVELQSGYRLVWDFRRPRSEDSALQLFARNGGS